MKKMMLIVNPVSGKGQAKSALFDVLSIFCAEGWTVTVYMTQKRGDGEVYARDLSGEYDMVVCIGGDGTLSEVTSGLMALEERPLLGYIPMGTTNDVATTLELKKNPKEAAKSIVSGNVMPFDIGKLEDKYFSYVAAFGAFTEVSYTTPQTAKKTWGHMAYIFEGLGSLPKITARHAVVEYDDGVIEGDYIFGAVTNSTSVAGIVKLDPNDVSFSDGYFEVFLVKKLRKGQGLGDFSSILTSVVNKNFNSDQITFLHTKKVSFKFDQPVAWTRDGESGGVFSRVSAENIHEALKIVV